MIHASEGIWIDFKCQQQPLQLGALRRCTSDVSSTGASAAKQKHDVRDHAPLVRVGLPCLIPHSIVLRTFTDIETCNSFLHQSERGRYSMLQRMPRASGSRSIYIYIFVLVARREVPPHWYPLRSDPRCKQDATNIASDLDQQTSR